MGVVISEAYAGGVVNNTAITTNQIFPVPSSLTLATGATTAAVCQVPGSAKLNGKYFQIRIGGFCIAGASMNVTPVLYSGTSITVASNTVISAGTAFATGGALTFPFSCTYTFQGDNTSGFLQATASQQMNNTLVVGAAATKLTGVNFNTTDPALSLVFGLTFSVANASNTATLLQFVLEA